MWAQIENAELINQQRMMIWNWYHQAFAELEIEGIVRRPIFSSKDLHNAHMYYLLLPDLQTRNMLIEKLKKSGIHAVFHYVPLHSSPAGVKWGRAHGDMFYTGKISDCLVRLPFWIGLTEEEILLISQTVKKALC